MSRASCWHARMRGGSLFTIAILIACGLLPGGCEKADDRSGTVTVAAAADLKFALDDILREFQKREPSVRVSIVYGSSGNFHAQLSNRAPFDVFLSADIDYPKKLIEAGLASEQALFEYAIGQIVVWASNDTPFDVRSLGGESLVHPSVRKIAIANPRHAPYGRAAEAALRTLGLHDRVADRLVLGENIAQAAQFVETGAADIGIIALSLALAPRMQEKGGYWAVPLEAYPTMLQGGIILPWAKDPQAAARFRDFMTGPGGQAIFKQYGFMPPRR